MFVLCGLFNACSGAPELGQSGFLRDYSQLKPDPAFDGALRYEHPSKKLGQYRKFIIDPVMIHFAPHAEGAAIDPTELKQLADYFRDVRSAALVHLRGAEVERTFSEGGSAVLLS